MLSSMDGSAEQQWRRCCTRQSIHMHHKHTTCNSSYVSLMITGQTMQYAFIVQKSRG